MEEICCAECGDGLGLWFPAHKYKRNVYCEECWDGKTDEDCIQEKESLEEEVAEAQGEKDVLEAEVERLEGELQDAEIREADLETQLEEPIEA